MQTQKRFDPNYLMQINAFHRFTESCFLPHNARLLWFSLMDRCNACGWPEWVQIDALHLMAMLDVKSENTVFRARDALVKAGLLVYKKGRKGCPNCYRLIFFSCNNECISGSISACPNEVQTEVQANDINKHKQNKTKPNIKKIQEEADLLSAPADGGAPVHTDVQSVVDAFNRICRSLPQVQTLSDKRRQAIRAAEKTVGSFGGWDKLFHAVEDSDFLTGRSGSWTGCGFDWILKPANLVKILEGNYAGKSKRKGGFCHDDSIDTGVYL